MSDFETQRNFYQGAQRGRFVRERPARVGRPDGAGVYTLAVPGGHSYVWIRLLQGVGLTIGMALDEIGLSSPTDDNAPIWVDQYPDGRLVATRRRYEG